MNHRAGGILRAGGATKCRGEPPPSHFFFSLLFPSLPFISTLCTHLRLSLVFISSQCPATVEFPGVVDLETSRISVVDLETSRISVVTPRWAKRESHHVYSYRVRPHNRCQAGVRLGASSVLWSSVFPFKYSILPPR